jgi:hypothetical protein
MRGSAGGTHVEHPICFIEHEILDLREIAVALPIRSSRRPGVAITMSVPDFSASICGRSPTPPKIVAVRSGRCLHMRARFLDLRDELAGRRETRHRVTRRLSSDVWLQPERIGSVNAAVLPCQSGRCR